jgi:hypothetical protein
MPGETLIVWRAGKGDTENLTPIHNYAKPRPRAAAAISVAVQAKMLWHKVI